ncbi:MAG: hypothetical protein IKD76_08535 [Clostridia bacterium]|nr:hypothetical protein [Clostridia bacterium]
MTEQEKQKILRYLEEFELVNPETGDVYVEKDVYIELSIGKTGTYEYNIKDSNEEEIGKCLNKKTIILSAKYKEKKQKEIDGKEFDFDADLEVDIDKMLERQRQKEENERLASEINNKEHTQEDEKDNKDLNEEPNKQDSKEKENEDKEKEKKQGEPISQEELKEQGYDGLTYSLIKDENIINALVVDNYDPRTVIVTEDKGQIKFLAREVGTGDLKELPQVPTSTSGEQVNEFNNGREKSSVVTNKVALANCPNMEFSIDKNKVGQLELYCIDNIDKEGDREAIPVKTQAVHPTMEEYKRTVYEKYGYEFDDRMEEIDARLADEKESIRDDVYEEIDDMEELPDDQELEEIIEDEELEEQEEELVEEEEIEEEIEEEEPYKAPWDGHNYHKRL